MNRDLSFPTHSHERVHSFHHQPLYCFKEDEASLKWVIFDTFFAISESERLLDRRVDRVRGSERLLQEVGKISSHAALWCLRDQPASLLANLKPY